MFLGRTSGFFFIVLLQLVLFVAFLFLGLNIAERGSQQLLGLAEEVRAFSFNAGDTGLIITFAGKDYLVPWKEYWADLAGLYFSLKSRYLN